MNKKRKKRIEEALDVLEQQHEIIMECKDEEETAHDSLPDPFQYSERGEVMQEIVNDLDYALDSLSDAIDNIKEALELC